MAVGHRRLWVLKNKIDNAFAQHAVLRRFFGQMDAVEPLVEHIKNNVCNLIGKALRGPLLITREHYIGAADRLGAAKLLGAAARRSASVALVVALAVTLAVVVAAAVSTARLARSTCWCQASLWATSLRFWRTSRARTTMRRTNNHLQRRK